MTKKNRGLLVSMVAGLTTVVLLIAVLLIQMFAPPAPAAEGGLDHEATPATAESLAGDGQTMVMSDGSTMGIDEMDADHGAAGAGVAEPIVDAAPAVEAGGHSMAGMIDWGLIGLILALIAACVAVTTALMEYLRRQIAAGAYLRPERSRE